MCICMYIYTYVYIYVCIYTLYIVFRRFELPRPLHTFYRQLPLYVHLSPPLPHFFCLFSEPSAFGKAF